MSHELPLNYQYTRDHLWLRAEGDELILGMTIAGLEQLGELAYFEPLPAGSALDAGEICATIEGEAGSRALLAPATGSITAINEELSKSPDLVAESPYTEGWLMKFKVEEHNEGTLLSAGDYQSYLESL